MVPLLGGAFSACVYHFFYNSPQLDALVALQVTAHTGHASSSMRRGILCSAATALTSARSCRHAAKGMQCASCHDEGP